MNGWFDAESAIAARLAERLPEVPIRIAHEEAGYPALAGNAQTAVIVQYAGYGIADTAVAGATALIEQAWLVSVFAREVSDQRGAAGIRALAGPLLMRALGALAGYRLPLSGVRPLVPTRAPREQIADSAGVFPLAFALRFAACAQPA